MSNEINIATNPDLTIYVLVFNRSGQVYDTVDGAFESYATAQRANYDVSLTEQGTSSGIYYGNFPSTVLASGTYAYYAYIQSGGSPAEGDVLVGTGTVDWTGSASASAVPGSMTGSDFRDYVLRGGFKRTDKDTELYEAVTDTIEEMRRRFNFQEAQVESSTTDTISVDGDYKIAVESDFGLLTGVVIEDDEDAWTLNQISKYKFDQLYPDANVTNDRGSPENFCIFNDQILIGPIPDKTTYVYRKTYSSKGGTITSSTSAVPFTAYYREILRNGVLTRLWEIMDRYDRSQYYKALFEQGMDQAMRREEQITGEHVFAVQPDDTFNC